AAVSDAEAEQMQKQANPDDNVADSAWNAILRRQVQAAVTSLPPEQNQIIRMAYFQGMTRQEIAQTTQTPLGTVHTRARLALNKLRKILKAEEIEA
ncbi:MAG: sigma-70 family RNA polymerase sigma factor, partial [Anaerolineae bacterium]